MTPQYVSAAHEGGLRHDRCLLRILWIVISGKLLSSQLASLPPLNGGKTETRGTCFGVWTEEVLDPS
ncbi:hypothetical protein JOB18_048310 [Solea senegalensis]|uniref:Uncharacterized protein n=1 Tax=Solea senegalensis TaxID=28829 RepID=A0AAV6T2E6_SOLSE|nr:hypothetical protein JOB18_048310 [Solea senegalensis]